MWGRSTSSRTERRPKRDGRDRSLRSWGSDRLRRRVAAPLAALGLGTLALGFTASPVFGVRTVIVTGNDHVRSTEVIREAGLDRGANVYWFHAGAAERLLRRDPWIASATVTPVLPHTMRIRVRERTPSSRVRVGSVWLLVARDGTVLGPGGTGHALPVLPARDRLAVGEQNPAIVAAARVAGRMGPWLRSRVSAVLSQPDGEIVLELARGGRALLGPPDGLDAKDRALAGILRWAARRGHPVDYVDLRSPLAPAARVA